MSHSFLSLLAMKSMASSTCVLITRILAVKVFIVQAFAFLWQLYLKANFSQYARAKLDG